MLVQMNAIAIIDARQRGQITGLLHCMSPKVAHSGAALVGGMSAAGESRQPTVEPVGRF
jgi:hypothetical protein